MSTMLWVNKRDTQFARDGNYLYYVYHDVVAKQCNPNSLWLIEQFNSRPPARTTEPTHHPRHKLYIL